MGELSEQLLEQLKGYSPEGLRTADLLEIPPSVRRVVRLLMQEEGRTFEVLCRAVEENPQKWQVSCADLKEILIVLVKLQWASTEVKDGKTCYSVRLASKQPARRISRRRSSHDVTKRVWDALDNKGADFDLPAKRRSVLENSDEKSSSQEKDKTAKKEEGKKGGENVTRQVLDVLGSTSSDVDPPAKRRAVPEDTDKISASLQNDRQEKEEKKDEKGS